MSPGKRSRSGRGSTRVYGEYVRELRGRCPRMRLRGGVGPSRYAAEWLEERRLLTLTVPGYSSLPGAPQTLYLNFGGTAAAFDWNNGTQYRAHGPAGNDDPIPP